VPARRKLSVPLILLCVLLGVLLGSGGYTFWYAEGASYLSNDPRACVNCHVMRDHYDGWQKASHHAVATCNDCHTPHDFFGKYYTKAENGFWHSKGFTFQDFPEPIRIRPRNYEVLNANCRECHAGLVSQINAAHGYLDDTGALDCIRCHKEVGHGPTR